MTQESQDKTTAPAPPAAPPKTRPAGRRRKSVSPKKAPAEGPSKKAEKKVAGPRHRPAPKPREAEKERELTFEIEHLRSLACQITTRYLEGLESEIVQIREAVMTSRGNPGRLGRLETMLHAFEGLKVKPDKGRRKDLQRISDLVALLNRMAQKL